MYHSEEVRRLAPEMDPLRLGMGWKLEDLEKPKVIIESTFGDSHPGSAHLLKFVDTAAAGVAAAGGRAARYFTTDICDGMAQGHDGINYSLASRDMIANMVEIHNNATPFDAGVFIASCDKGLPGLLMGIGRTDLPAVVVTGGVMEAGPDLLTLEQIGAYSAMCQRGEISEAQLTYYKHHACPSCGACSFMGTAGTMQVMCEALGLTLPGSALLPATSADLVEVARKAGAQAVELAKRGLTARDIVTRESFENAIIVHAAISGSTNAILHLPAIAHEFGIEIDADTFERIHKSAHYLLDVRPAGRWPSEYVYYAGGVPAIMEEVRHLLHLDVMTVTGKTLGENLDGLKAGGYYEKCAEYLKKTGVKKEDIIPFAGNVNPLGISPLLKKSMASHIESISEYPDRDYKELRSTLALYCNVPMEHIIVGNGATEMISLTMQLLRPKHALLLSPTYSEYTREIDLVGGHVEEYFLREDLDFKLDLNDLISKLTDDIDLLAICNPNNPTSSALNTEEITKILTHCKLHDIFVMIDETYVEFAPDIDTISAVSLTTKFDNFMILRGTSKFFCAPGLRLGYGICGNLAFLERMNNIKNPWTINTLAALAGEAMFMDTDYIQATKDYIQSERTRCIDILSKRDNLKIYPAYANFILVKLLDGTTSFEMFERCIKSGLMIRDCASFHGLDGEFIRFCIQKKEDNDRLLNLLTL